MALPRSIILPALLCGATLLMIAASGLVMQSAPSLGQSILRADTLGARKQDAKTVTRINLVGEKASRCKGSSGFGSVRTINCKTSGASMHKRGNIVFAKPPR